MLYSDTYTVITRHEEYFWLFDLVLIQVREIEGLSHLTHLRVLNLAGNDISCVANLSGLQALAELNLRRNRITSIVSYMYTQSYYAQ